ncbi:MAG: hypothetical protein ACI9O4_002413 [Chitinophagales bacterium]|jgi:hypothetical protein
MDKNKTNFVKNSYGKHAKGFKVNEENIIKNQDIWFGEGSVDY